VCIRYTDSPNDPVITAESPFVSIGTGADVGTALTDPKRSSTFRFAGKPSYSAAFDDLISKQTDFIPQRCNMYGYRENGRKFLVAPQKLDNL
jgi:hypothetical protein